MQFPISTGQAARLLDTTEPHLSEAVRRGKIRPEPTVLAGRRLWERAHLIRAAQVMGVPIATLDSRLGGETGR